MLIYIHVLIMPPHSPDVRPSGRGAYSAAPPTHRGLLGAPRAVAVGKLSIVPFQRLGKIILGYLQHGEWICVAGDAVLTVDGSQALEHNSLTSASKVHPTRALDPS